MTLIKTSLLFGSGISRYSKLPDVKELTNFILNTNEVARDYDMNYYIYPKRTNCEYVKSIQKLLHYLKNIIEDYHIASKIRYELNYEELYYIIDQINKSERKEYENPAIYPLIKEIQRDFKREISFYYNNSMERFMDESKTYIHYIIYYKLQISNGNFDQFKILNEIIKENSDIDIFTLNHDIILETFFRTNGINFNNNFEKINETSVFKKELLNNTEGLNLFKLHGSIDWLILEDGKLHCITLDNNKLIDNSNTLKDFLSKTNSLPYFLIGTFNKMLNYLSGYYELIFDAFKDRILNTDKLIISGYGFCDKGINTRINYFINQTGKNIIIVDPNKSHLIETARGSFHIQLLNNPKVRFVEKRFEDVSVDDL